MLSKRFRPRSNREQDRDTYCNALGVQVTAMLTFGKHIAIFVKLRFAGVGIMLPPAT